MTWKLRTSVFAKNMLALSAISFALVVTSVGCGKATGGSTNGMTITTGDQDSNSIIGGTTVASTDDISKSIVSLINVDIGSICTASILSDSLLVTAAHCVDGSPASLRVVFGVDVNSPNIIVRPVRNYVVSPFWVKRQNMDINTGDVAVVKFVGGLPTGFKASKLLTDASQLVDGKVVTLAGYGISIGKPAKNSDGGAGLLRQVQVAISKVAFSQTEILMDQTQGKGACHGDSGGPAYVQVGNERLLFGVTSRGVNDPDNDCSKFAAYTNLLVYSKWIAAASQKLDATPAATPKAVNTASNPVSTGK